MGLLKRWREHRAFAAELEAGQERFVAEIQADREQVSLVLDILQRAQSEDEVVELLQRELGWDEVRARNYVEIRKMRLAAQGREDEFFGQSTPQGESGT